MLMRRTSGFSQRGPDEMELNDLFEASVVKNDALRRSMRAENESMSQEQEESSASVRGPQQDIVSATSAASSSPEQAGTVATSVTMIQVTKPEPTKSTNLVVIDESTSARNAEPVTRGARGIASEAQRPKSVLRAASSKGSRTLALSGSDRSVSSRRDTHRRRELAVERWQVVEQTLKGALVQTSTCQPSPMSSIAMACSSTLTM
jgi:hypothetical protein